MSDTKLSAIQQLQHSLHPAQGILLSTPTDITYFTGFQFLVPEEREAILLVTAQQLFLVKTSFSVFEPPAHVPITVLLHCNPSSLSRHMLNAVKTSNLTEILLDESSLFVSELRAIETELRQTNCVLKPLDRQLIWTQRMIKTADEVTLMKKAAEIVQAVLGELPKQFHEGVTEKKLRAWIEERFRKFGADQPAFPTIVAFGPNAALPHYQPQDVPLQLGVAILVDAGARYHGYRSDMTRTWWFGEENPEFGQIEKIVREAYDQALHTLKAHGGKSSTKAKDLDNAARTVITKYQFQEQFIHTTGHGVGLDIHEPPSLNWQNEQMIMPGMVLTIEPGIYLPGKFGYRHENTVLVTEQSAEELTS